ncbi:hypothetical protein [Isoalcanivorax indicus]|uniref:hypothetical protein n=1 Tax=Isoalcanivorax indicus TaxID=2202653 RepID=UPI000DB951CA|nr:hypothetical protein [Isoalcanivorax indicus]
MNHGRRLSKGEFERLIVALNSALPENPEPLDLRALARREFEAMINYRLGEDFPLERRQILWDIQQRYQRGMINSMALLLSKKLLETRLNWLADVLIGSHKACLTQEEFEALFSDD